MTYEDYRYGRYMSDELHIRNAWYMAYTTAKVRYKSMSALPCTVQREALGYFFNALYHKWEEE